ncbi:ABC transporter permease [Bacillus pseudomycoides]|uniref:ABC transporter permease n=2 Tax=Bacillus pseudomycoides TaxID=64104 RepID=A0A2C3XQ91_9BACI|nr:ABC transporter permease [Bacillus pseudomycoides]PDY44686.1 ABC transporter permease [Bacillus pseudomycoides]PEA81480.1 ABC transporter permease [Bacillus pseudomycoides]PED06141.1 ABC transporter permease [Bacillus pseudomycoides]PED68924.1 ABC transporter permease [Bacillus pseudomycoides]PEI43918.1 ABC transporter permease [Bacillus pseudomycoides]
MMQAVLKSELIKLKGSKLLYLTTSLQLITVLLVFFIYASNPKYSIAQTGWDEYYQTIYIFFNLMTGTATFYIVTGYIFSREYQEGTNLILFTSPISKLKFYFGKLLIIFSFIVFTMLIILVLPFCLGMLITDLPFTFKLFMRQLKVVSLMAIMHFCLIPIASFIAIKWKSFLYVVTLMCLVLFFNIMLVNSPGNFLYPWIVPLIFSPHEGMGRTFISYPIGTCSILFILILGLTLSIYEYRKIR